MAYNHWFLVQRSDCSFRFVGEGRFVNFRLGKGKLPEVRSGEVRVVDVVLDLEDDLDAWLIHVEYRRFPVLASGYRDPASIEWEWSLVRAVVGTRATTQPGSPERQLATRQTAQTFRWKPTADEVRAIGDAISRRAKRPLLGGNPLRLLASTVRRSRRSEGALSPTTS
jgi:hypothetical protein